MVLRVPPVGGKRAGGDYAIGAKACQGLRRARSPAPDGALPPPRASSPGAEDGAARFPLRSQEASPIAEPPPLTPPPHRGGGVSDKSGVGGRQSRPPTPLTAKTPFPAATARQKEELQTKWAFPLLLSGVSCGMIARV